MLNGGSSSGKSTLARRLQDLLPEAWLTLGTDTLVDALPGRLRSSHTDGAAGAAGADGTDGIGIADSGEVVTGEEFRRLDEAWARGVAAIVRAGVPVVVDEVFLGGPRSQARWRAALAGTDVLWVGVRCDPEVAAAREAARGDRVGGMARLQAELVHRGVEYDLEVDSGKGTPEDCAAAVAGRVTR
ncbi:chloramphenicol 3-O phosphotransferase [Actinacidiphila rubida]|uniref:Chloramphenicol 3-O phosphotransferase n=2 Tax=Actinacidiphila rubida TaxID=310780 RepID=A0A1H8QCG4_9ACTN|nr:chloramphenicol 3-O phosphotransferase [Actinacidiphila rubida]